MLERRKGTGRTAGVNVAGEGVAWKAPIQPQAFITEAALATFMLSPQFQVIFQKASALLKVSPIAEEIPPQWLADLDAPPILKANSGREGLCLRWLKAKALPKSKNKSQLDPRRSYFYLRGSADGTQTFVLVLLASLVWRDDATNDEKELWGGQGVRMLARPVFRPGSIDLEALTESHSLPTVPDGDVEHWNTSIATSDVDYLMDPEHGPKWISAAGLDPNGYESHRVGLHAHWVDAGQPTFEFRARLQPLRDGGVRPSIQALDASAHEFEAIVRSAAGQAPSLESRRRYPLFANLKLGGFTRDPPSRDGSRVLRPAFNPGVPDGRTSAASRALNYFRQLYEAGVLPKGKAAGTVKLEDPLGRFFVAQSRHVEGGTPGFDENQPVELPWPSVFDVRTDEFAAINAFLRGIDFFWRLDHYYLDVSTQLKFVTLPIPIRYRAGVIPGGGDGRIVNAQVRWYPSPRPKAFPAHLEMRFGLADLACNEGRVTRVRRTGIPRAPLSIAADRRWCWHEFGHVLLAGGTNCLELHFAHSVGDALGAVLSDPLSALALEGAWRGVTYPWQSLPNRRHDREAKDGWSWSGTFGKPTRAFAGVGGHYDLAQGGYCSEELMSSSVFRMYRCLGGDARKSDGSPDVPRRTLAAEYTAYLVMCAVGLIGSSDATAVTTVEKFEETVESADKSMPTFAMLAPNVRYAGMALKAVRWAFEQQGAFAVGPPLWSHNEPGPPPNVDVYIRSRRPGSKGGYEPVSWRDDAHLADAGALWVQWTKAGPRRSAAKGGATNFVYVAVDNRGLQAGMNTTVRVFRARRLPGGGVRPWTDPAWMEILEDQPGNGGPRDVPSGASVTFGPFKWNDAKPGSDYALLAVATCADDRANLDPLAAVACRYSPCDIVATVVTDNNLGLAYVKAQ